MKHSVILLLVVLLVTSAPSITHGAKKGGLQYSASVGLGAGFPYNPDSFKDNWDPGFGLLLDFGVGKSLLEASVSMDYNFFLSNAAAPEDVNTLALFGNLKIKPISKTSVRPYILLCGGYFRYWIVDLDVYENAIGFGGGAGVELEMNDEQRLFIEAKNIIGQTREVNPTKANTEYIPVRVGITFVF